MVAKQCRVRDWCMLFAGLASAVCLGLAGCGSDRVPVAPVEGKVFLRGRPLESGWVTFQPTNGGPAATGEIEKDGTFRLSTYENGDGAPIGTHKVAVASFRKPTAQEQAAMAGSEPLDAIPILPQKYLTPATSGLTAEVKPQNEPYRFELVD
jgi:hypothetical protein